MNRIGLLALASVAATLGIGCVSTTAHDHLVERVNNEQDLNTAMREELLRVQNQLADADRQILEYQEALKAAQAKPADTSLDVSALDALMAEIRKELGGTTGGWDLASNGAVGTRLDDNNELLFKSGSWTLNDTAKKSLDKIAGDIKKFLEGRPDFVVRIDGHTDSDPIKSLKKEGIESNLELSFNRANAVLKHLVAAGVPEARCSVMTFGEHRPVAKEKKNNRRVEIWVSTPEGFSYSKSMAEGGSSTVSSK
ncbi:MAG: OmpA family protein [Planctomycetes bacterium]|nr:OmpA family protein [Planctomycetota bacterium]NUQ34130.1 OmpA family protein [Planctomycetaceae bacterium]